MTPFLSDAAMPDWILFFATALFVAMLLCRLVATFLPRCALTRMMENGLRGSADPSLRRSFRAWNIQSPDGRG
ncbi:hypothetical protein [Pseudoruegeria aquimaris]|nr:hypothetical protein [Pseudoruegeria aquimaris]